MLKRVQFFVGVALLTGFAWTAAAGSITGTIHYEGVVPALKPLNMDADPACAVLHGDKPTPNEVLVLGEAQTMGNILVDISKGAPEKEYPAPAAPFVVSQKGCVYGPRVFGVRVGQTVQVQNPDGIFHNVNGAPKTNVPFNKAMPKGVDSIEVVFDRAERPFELRCNVHPWMVAHCAVFDHPFFTVTDTDGTYTIDGLAPGEYEVRVWHEKLGEKTATVTVKDDTPVVQDFVLSR